MGRILHHVNRWRDTGLLRWVLAVGTVLVCTGWTGYVLRHNKTIDFYVYYTGGLAVRQRADILELSREEYRDLGGFPGYRDDQICYENRYPPFFNWAMMAFTLLPPRQAAALWTVLSLLAFLSAVRLLTHSFRATWSQEGIWALAATSVPALATLHAGQVNLFVLSALAAALYAYRRKHPVWTGIALGIAAFLKLSPAVLILYMLWRRQFRVVSSAALTLLGGFFLSLPSTGITAYLSYLRHYEQVSLSNALILYPPNQSLGGLIARLSIYLPGSDVLYLYVIWLTRLAFVATTLWLCWPPGEAHWKNWMLEFSLVITVLLLILPFAWLHLLVLSLVPESILFYQLLIHPRRRRLLVVLAVACVLVNIQGLLWHQLQAWRPYSPFVSLGTFGLLIIWGLLAALLLANKPSDGATEAHGTS